MPPPTKTITRTVPEQDYPAGVYEQTIPNTGPLKRFNYLEIVLTRVGWNGETVLAAPIGPTDTVITVADASTLPLTGPRTLALVDPSGDDDKIEGVTIQSVAGNQLTVTRGLLGVPLAFPSGTAVRSRDLAKLETWRVESGVEVALASAIFGASAIAESRLRSDWVSIGMGRRDQEGDIKARLTVWAPTLRTEITVTGGQEQ